MKLAKHVVLAVGLATAGSFDADAGSPSTTPQPLQSIPASSVPIAAAGPDAPGAHARKDSKEAPVESLKTIAELAIKSVEADVETVKWIVTAIFSAMAGLVALLGFLGFKTFTESRELVQKIAKEASENLSTLGSSISEMMTIQNSIEANYPRLTSLVDEIRATQPSDQGLSEKSSNRESIAKQIIDDLNRMREHDKVSNRVAPNQEPRWAALIDGWHGLTLHLVGRGEKAIPYLKRAIQLSRGGDESAKSRRASHLYNLACCYAVLGKNDEALTNLKASLALAPWRHVEASKDNDLKGLWCDPMFLAIIGDAQW